MKISYVFVNWLSEFPTCPRSSPDYLHVFGDPESPITPSIFMINSDSESALKAVKNPVFHARIKHFDMRHHFIRDIVSKGDLSVEYIPGDENPADIFTKSLDHNKHAVALSLLRMA